MKIGFITIILAFIFGFVLGGIKIKPTPLWTFDVTRDCAENQHGELDGQGGIKCVSNDARNGD